MLKTFSLKDVKLLDARMQKGEDMMLDYLLSLEEDKFIAGFLETNGIEPRKPRYGGWEQSELRGHIIGHYLKALCQVYERRQDEAIKQKLCYIIDELARAQHDDGYLSAYPVELLDRIERNVNAWAPWYTMHKIITGISAVYRATGYEKALQVLTRLADWVAARATGWSDGIRARVLTYEYGGMNDAMYEVYEFTHDEKHLRAAHCFDEMALFASVQNMWITHKLDAISGKHANTMIPKFVGAMKRLEVTDEDSDFYFAGCEKFWNLVVKHHSYITGGHGDGESFGPIDTLSNTRNSTNNETCNIYNMLKLTREIFRHTPKAEYMAFYERAFTNQILSSQHPETGMTTYYQGMRNGCYRIYGRPFDKFWCCTGTGMENFTKLGDSVYFADGETLYVTLPISTQLNWADMGVTVTLINSLLENGEMTLKVDGEEKAFTLKLRKPDWLKGGVTLKLNGEEIALNEEEGYITLNRVWKKGDTLALQGEAKMWFEALPDAADVVAFAYGPYVLSTPFGCENKCCHTIGANNDVEIVDFNQEVPTAITLPEEREAWLANLEKHLLPVEGKPLHFQLKGTDMDDLVFFPFRDQHHEKYGVYFTLK